FGQLLVTPLPFDVADAVGALAPWLVLGTDRPRFDDAELAVGAPVQDQAEFPVRPLRKFPDDERIGFRNVAVAFLLRRGCRGQRGVRAEARQQRQRGGALQDFATCGHWRPYPFVIPGPPQLHRGGTRNPVACMSTFYNKSTGFPLSRE